jgi:hypothetical protein
LHIGDTGLACSLLGTDAAGLWQDRTLLGQLLETFVYNELRRHASWHDGEIRFSHYRDKDGAEVDLVLERGGGQVAGVEVKAAATVAVSWTQTHYEKLAAGLTAAPDAAQAKVTSSGGRVAPLAMSSPLLGVDYLVARDQATDDKVASLAAIKDQLTHLDLSRTAVTDSGLAVLKGLPRLSRLDLHATRITDAGLKHLAGLSHLIYLNLYDTAVTDAGLSEIAKLKGLRSVYLWNSKVTEKGVQELKKELPMAEVNWK